MGGSEEDKKFTAKTILNWWPAPRETIIAQEDSIRLVAKERQCKGTMKLLENRSNLDLTGIRNLELRAWNTFQSYPSCPKLDNLRIWRS